MNIILLSLTLGSMLITSITHAMETTKRFALETPFTYQEKLGYKLPVRILLSESKLQNLAWTLSCEGGFEAYLSDTEPPLIIDETDVTISFSEGTWVLNSDALQTSSLVLYPREGFLHFKGIPYNGIFSLHSSHETAAIVNHLELDEYIEAVLRSETVTDWPEEVLKALCIATRTFTLHRILEQRSSEETPPYDLKSTILDQVYKGHASEVSLKHIVESTKDLIITDEGQPILAMYHAVCGGIVPALKRTDIFTNAPYLKRDYACTYCTKQKYYRWKLHISFDDIESSLKELFPDLGTIQDILLQDYDEAGIGHQVSIVNTDNYVFTLPAHDFRLRFYATIRSLCCTFKTKDRVLYAEGKGYGHHIGACQWGAYYMADEGFSWENILEYYYPGTTITTLEFSSC